MIQIYPFTVQVSQQQIDDLKLRLALARFPEQEPVDDWSQGVPLNYLKEMATYWANDYDMKRLETRLNALPQFIANIDDLDIHFIHVKSPEANARPLILTHGWPGSVVEFLKVIAPLSDPVAHGGKPEDAFHVVCPSLPGYGFSGKPLTTGWGVEKIAKAWGQLMTALSYEHYFAQGGDWGSAVTTKISQLDENCRAIHLNVISASPTPEQAKDITPEEQCYLDEMKYYQQWDSGYNKQQATRPQTIGYSLVDSPVGLLAWILEKFRAWTDCNGHPENALSRDEMLDNIMVYWLNAAGASSARLYWESQSLGPIPSYEIHKPTGISMFPKEIIRSSKRWAENTFKNIHYWNELDKGGHFPAFEQPELFVTEVRCSFNGMK